MDEHTPETPVPAQPEYRWPQPPAEPAPAAAAAWSAGPAEPVEAAWTADVEPQAAASGPGDAEPEPVPTVPPAPAPAEPTAGAAEPPPAKTPLPRRELAFRRRRKAAEEPQTEVRRRRRPRLVLPRRRRPEATETPAAPERAGEPAPKRAKPERARRGSRSAVKLVGLKIGASQLAAARVVNNGAPQLVQVARGPLEHGVVVGGEVRDPERLAAALKEFFVRHKLPRRGVRLGLANNRIGVRVFELEGIDDPRQLANAIRFRAQEALPIPIDEAVLDYQVLEERTGEDGRTVRRILLVVAYRELIDRYVTACRKAGIQLAGIDLEAFALARALTGPRDLPDGAEPAATVAVSVGSDHTTFAVSDGTTCEFTRVLEWGGVSLDVALARALDLAPSEAEPVKRAVGLQGDETPDGLTPEAVATAREAMRAEVQTFARELVSSLQFYQNQPGSLGIAEIVLTGGTAHLAGLADALQKLIGVRVRVGDPLAHVRPGKRLTHDPQIGSLTIAIGLAVER